MNCENYSSLINVLVEEELDERSARKVLSHLTRCRNCEMKFENLFDETKLFADFLFEVKPPHDLSDQFRERLSAEKTERTTLAAAIAGFCRRLQNPFDFFHLKPVMGAVILLLIGFGYLGLRNSFYNDGQSIVLQKSAQNPVVSVNSDTNTPVNGERGKPGIAEPTYFPSQKNAVHSRRISAGKARKSELPAKDSAADKKSAVYYANARKTSERPKTDDDNQLRFKEIQAFKVDTRKQMEKVEMLLRSFRNAPIVEENDSFDVVYEKQQARKLLERNIKLRKFAQSYAGFDIQETLQTTEALLNDIAGLDNNPSPEQVISIKKRVDNQNIIAALQIF